MAAMTKPTKPPEKFKSPNEDMIPTPLADRFAKGLGPVNLEMWKAIRLTEMAGAGHLPSLIEWLTKYGGAERQLRE